MKLALRVLALAFAVLVVIVALEIVAAESGEVVVLRTAGEGGEPEETRLWVVEHEGHAYLRAGHEGAGWFVALRAQPAVEVERGGETRPYTAVPDVTAREPINARMLEKYGWADRYIGFLFGRDDSIPIRLDPR